MRFVVLLGGACGFTLALGASLWTGHGGERTFLDASVGCLAGGLIFRGFWAVLLSGIRQAFLARRAAALLPVPPPPPAPAPVPAPKTR